MVDINGRLNAFVSRVMLVKSQKTNAELKVNDLFSKLTSSGLEIDEYKQGIALCDQCISDQIKLKKHFEESTTKFLNTVLIDMAEPTDTPIPRLEYILEPVLDEFNNVVGLKPLVKEEGKEADAINEFGTSVRNLIGLANRTIAVAISKGLRPLIIGDEMAVNLHYSVWSRIADYYLDLQRVMGEFQLVIISNVTENFPTTYKVVKRGDTSYVYPNPDNEYVGRK